MMFHRESPHLPRGAVLLSLSMSLSLPLPLSLSLAHSLSRAAVTRTGAEKVVDRALSPFHAGLRPPAVQVRGSESVLQRRAAFWVPRGPAVRRVPRGV